MWYPVQILNFSLALGVFTVILTLLALWRPRGPQPATYGHIQTLANLIDEWPAEGQKQIYWGHKGLYEPGCDEDMSSDWDVGEKWCHTGTSSEPLGTVKINALYA